MSSFEPPQDDPEPCRTGHHEEHEGREVWITLRKEKTRHWHIDWLTQVARIAEIWVNIRPKSRECECHRRVLALPGAGNLIPKFGSSDCRCPSHLAYFPRRPKLRGDGFQSTRGKKHQQFGTRRQS
ncbi:MAG: DUF123 domain-containing protein [Deltaproteobacteria bacterium]|nr:DUF123 domain-containing protein [Deltaproteobacteria bacterium]